MTHVVQPRVDCSTAQEFMDALSPFGLYFKDEIPNASWLFRGQGVDKPLIPSLFRKDGKILSLTDRNVSNYSELRLAERDILVRFFQIADKRGLVLPDDSQELRSFLELLKDNDDMVGVSYGGWNIEEKSLSVIALAQHYGIPTRLLDWTRQAYIAAFFACEDAYKHANKRDLGEKLVVWAFYFPAFDKQTRYRNESYLLRGVTAPSATNANIKAQQGVFTLSHQFYTKESVGSYLTIDVVLEEQAAQIVSSDPKSNNWIVKCKLIKFTLPISEALHALFLLAKMDITPSAIYPGYQSIVSDLQMQNLWTK